MNNNQPELEELTQRKNKQKMFQVLLDDVDCDVKVEMVFTKFPLQIEQLITEDEGNYWHYVQDQELIEQENGMYLVKYQNEEGQEGIIYLSILDSGVIQITCNYDHNSYIGMVTEDDLKKTTNSMPIEQLFDVLIEELKDPNALATENELIQFDKIGDNLRLTIIIHFEFMSLRKYTVEWNLILQENENRVGNQSFEDIIQDLHQTQKENQEVIQRLFYQKSGDFQKANQKYFDKQYTKNELITKKLQDLTQQFKSSEPIEQQQSNLLKTIQQQLEQQYKQTLLRNQKVAEQQKVMQYYYQSLNQLVEQQNANQNYCNPQLQNSYNIPNQNNNKIEQMKKNNEKIKKQFQDFRDALSQQNNLIQLNQQLIEPQLITIQQLNKISGQFRVLQKSLKGEITLKFKINQLPQNGLVIGLNQSTNPVQNQPIYGIYISHALLMIRQTQTQIQYAPKVGDQICFRVDMNQLIAVLQVNQQKIIDFELNNQEQRKLYLQVGYFSQYEMKNIAQYLE